MKRRELVALALTAPFVRLDRIFTPAAPAIRVFADLKHTGRLAGPVRGAIADKEFGIAVPLPTALADAELLPTSDAEGGEIAPRLGLLRLEGSEVRGDISISASGVGNEALRLYRKTTTGWQ